MAELTPEQTKYQHPAAGSTTTSLDLEVTLDALQALAESLNEPLSPERWRQMAVDLLSRYTVEEITTALLEWRMGDLNQIPTADLRFFPKTPQIARVIQDARADPGNQANKRADQAANKAFLEVIEVLRKRGLELKPLGGHIVRDRDNDGRLLAVPERAPREPFAGFSAPIHAALEMVGWGDFQKGLEYVAEHPALAQNSERSGFMVRTAESIEKRWRECFKEPS